VGHSNLLRAELEEMLIGLLHGWLPFAVVGGGLLFGFVPF
jgi:hypothetical protein